MTRLHSCRAGPAQLEPDAAVRPDVAMGAVATVLARLLEGAAVHLRLERGGVGGYVGGPLDLEAATGGDSGDQEDGEGGGETFWHAVAIGGSAAGVEKRGRGLAAQVMAHGNPTGIPTLRVMTTSVPGGSQAPVCEPCAVRRAGHISLGSRRCSLPGRPGRSRAPRRS